MTRLDWKKMPRKKRKNDKTSQIAAPVREYLRQIIRAKLSTPAERQALAKFLGQKPTSVSNLLQGEGGLDTWLAALVFCFGLETETLVEHIQNYQALLRKQHPRESDRLAAQIDLPESKRKVLFSALLTALAVDDEKRPMLSAAERRE
jgi:plasmid maintenance system antidote protein VapI